MNLRLAWTNLVPATQQIGRVRKGLPDLSLPVLSLKFYSAGQLACCR